MRTLVSLGVLMVGTTLVVAVHADPPPTRPSDVTTCTVTLPPPATTFVASFDGSMAGTVTIDGAAGTRRFKVKSTPYSATYILMFQGYGPGDQKPASESFKVGKSVIARLVAFGDVNHLFFDTDYSPPGVRAQMAGFICK